MNISKAYKLLVQDGWLEIRENLAALFRRPVKVKEVAQEVGRIDIDNDDEEESDGPRIQLVETDDGCVRFRVVEG